MKKNILMWMFLAFTQFAVAQVLTVENNETGEYLSSASISSDNPKAFAVTNARGQADISEFRGAERIIIRRLGYKTELKSFAELEAMGFELKMTATSTHFDEVVVSASRWTQTASNVPSKISIISVEDVALQNPQTAADLLGASGEVFIQKSQQGGGSPMIRGFSTNRLLYTIDGVRMNTAIFRGGNIQNVISLDPFAIENTEVFFGPGSIIYGSDAIGAVMSFRTLTPQFSMNNKPLVTGGAVSRTATANSELSNHFHINVGWKKWALVSSVSHNKFGDLRMGTRGPDEYLKHFYVQRVDSLDRVFENKNPLIQNPSGYNQINFMQKIRFSPNKNWDFQYGFHFSETSEYSRYDRLIETQNNGLPASAVWNYGPQKWMMHNLSITYSKANKVFDQMSLRLAQQYFEESRIDRRFNHHRLRTQLEEVRAYSANLDFEKKIKKHQFYYGLEYVLNDVKSIGSAVDIRNGNPILVADRYPQSKWMSYAAYLSYQYEFSEKLIAQAGVRYNAFSIESDFTRNLAFFPFDFSTVNLNSAATTGSLGLVYKPDATTKISLSGGTGFRAPNVDDIGKIFDFGNTEVVVPNANLRAEYAYNAEFNVSKIFKDVVKLDVSGYYTYLDNALVRRAFQVNGQDSILYDGELRKSFAIQNAAYATVYGFHAGIEIKLPAGFGISSRYNYQLGTEEMDNGEISRSRHGAPAFGITRLTYQTSKLQIQIYAVYSAEVSYENLNEEERQKRFIYAQDANGNPYSPSWYTINFKAMYQFHPNLSVSAGLENITDQRYRPYSSGLVAPGRNFILSLRANF
jgi:hemoglobin/transferrin/lactoferrin receptor protein